jgi:hypothetical protein
VVVVVVGINSIQKEMCWQRRCLGSCYTERGGCWFGWIDVLMSNGGNLVALLAIWGIEIRAGKDIWGDMGDYWGLSGNKEKTRYFW